MACYFEIRRLTIPTNHTTMMHAPFLEHYDICHVKDLIEITRPLSLLASPHDVAHHKHRNLPPSAPHSFPSSLRSESEP